MRRAISGQALVGLQCVVGRGRRSPKPSLLTNQDIVSVR
jgi:hypothetical protein